MLPALRRAAVATLALGLLAGATPQPPPPGCPDGMVLVPGFASCIDVFPLPNVEGEMPWQALSGLPEVTDQESGEVWDVDAICRDQGKRPCWREEWVAACLGPGGSRWPWGDELPFYIPGEGEQLPCNGDKRYRPVDEVLVARRDPAELEHVAQLEPLGHRPECVSASGMRDAVGQVEQWVRCKEGRYGWCLMGGHSAGAKNCRQVITAHSPRWHYAASGGICCHSTVD